MFSEGRVCSTATKIRPAMHLKILRKLVTFINSKACTIYTTRWHVYTIAVVVGDCIRMLNNKRLFTEHCSRLCLVPQIDEIHSQRKCLESFHRSKFYYLKQSPRTSSVLNIAELGERYLQLPEKLNKNL